MPEILPRAHNIRKTLIKRSGNAAGSGINLFEDDDFLSAQEVKIAVKGLEVAICILRNTKLR